MSAQAPLVLVRGETAQAITIRREGTRVLLIVDGRAVAEMPWRKADELAVAIRSKARAAEEQEKALEVARDNAILLRAGVRIGLSDDPRIREETGKIAAWDRNLRRYMPGGIRSQELVGTPAVINHGRKSCGA